MRKTILAVAFILATGICITVQGQLLNGNPQVEYNFFTNNIPSDWNYPLIGFVNNVSGNHTSVQLGFVNNTTGNAGGVQTGFINNVGGQLLGCQGGFVNSVEGDFYGIQCGFVNSTSACFRGFQVGFVNSNKNTITGIQAGFVNSTEKMVGVQAGFVNSTGGIAGLQLGFVNSAETLKGLQLGFINSVGKVEKGLPIGFLSFVKEGGYKAVEVSYTNIYPVNIAFKTGIREFYTYPMLAYDSRLNEDRLAFGYGIGSNLDLNQKLFINPEIEWLHHISLDFNHYSTLRCNLGYKLGTHFEVLAGPSLVWHFKINADDFHQNYTEWDPSIVAINKLKAGFNVAVRYTF